MSSNHVLVVDLDESSRLDMLRRAMRLTHANQMSFSRLMGVTQPALSFWLSGKVPVPRWAAPAIVGACVMAGVSVQLPHPAKQLFKSRK